MAQISFQDIQNIKPGKTTPFVVDYAEAKRVQARISWCNCVRRLPKGVFRFATHYNKVQGVLMITAVPTKAE